MTKDWKSRKNRRRSVQGRKSSDNKEKYSVRKRYKDPQRGGYRPEDFSFDYDINAVSSALEQLANSGKRVFLDSNALSLTTRTAERKKLSEEYYTIIKYADDSGFEDCFENATKAMSRLIEFHRAFMSRSNVYVTEKINDEFDKYRKVVCKTAKSMAPPKKKKIVLTQIRQLSDIVKANAERTKVSLEGIKGITEKILSRIPDLHIEDGIVAALSIADKEIIAASLSTGFCYGCDSAIISNDRDIPLTLDYIRRLALTHNFPNLDGLVSRRRKFATSVYRGF